MINTLLTPKRRSSTPDDWGDLLFEPDLSNVLYRGNPFPMFMMVVVLIALVFSTSIVVRSSREGLDYVARYFTFVTVLCYFFCLSLFYFIGISRPFSIYTRGFTSPKVPFSDGFKNRDLFIPWDSVQKVVIGSWKNGRSPNPRSILLIHYRDGGTIMKVGVRMEIIRPFFWRPIELFRTYVPDRIDEIPPWVDLYGSVDGSVRPDPSGNDEGLVRRPCPGAKRPGTGGSSP